MGAVFLLTWPSLGFLQVVLLPGTTLVHTTHSPAFRSPSSHHPLPVELTLCQQTKLLLPVWLLTSSTPTLMGPYPEASWIPQKDGCREPALESLPPKARVPNKSHSRNTAPHFQVVTNPKLKKQTLFLFPNSSILGPSPSLPFTLRSAGQNQ